MTTFESFYTGTASRLLRYAYGLTGDMAEAQDFTQEAYARAWLRWKRLQQYENPESWLRLVVSRLAVDRLRWLRVRRAKTWRENLVAPAPNEEMLTLVAALKRLPIPQRRALVLHYFLDMPVAEIAAETGVGVNTVKTWLARGRANVAAELTDLPPAQGDLRGVREKARRRRNRTVATTITAFLATSAAVAAALLAFPQGDPPALNPDLIVPYADSPSLAVPIMSGERAITVWQGRGGQAHVGAIDVRDGTQPWPPVDLGVFNELFYPVGIRDGVVVVVGVDQSPETSAITFAGIDVRSGEVRWRRAPQPHGRLIFDLQLVAVEGKVAEAGILVVKDEATVSGIDWRTGRPVWTAASAPEIQYAPPDRDRLAELRPGGVLRMLDVRSGRVISERSGVPDAAPSAVKVLLDDWLYLTGSDGLLRVPIAGNEPAIQLVGGGNVRVRRCAKHICAEGKDFVAAFDRRTAKPVWRRETTQPGIVQASDAGIIVTVPGGRPSESPWLVADDRHLILDPDGRDITPSALGARRAYWIDDRTLIFSRVVERVVISGAEDPPSHVELSLYSLATRREQPLGQHYVRGECDGIPGRYVCAGKDGFILFH